MGSLFKNIIPCYTCWISREKKCCRNIELLIVSEEEADDFNRKYLVPIKGYESYYTVQYSNFDKSCPHLSDGKCVIYNKKPFHCNSYPMILQPTHVYFDLCCPGIATIFSGLKSYDSLCLNYIRCLLHTSKNKNNYFDLVHSKYSKVLDTYKYKISIDALHDVTQFLDISYKLHDSIVLDPNTNNGLRIVSIYMSTEFIYKVHFSYTDNTRNITYYDITKEDLDLILITTVK